VVDARNRKGWTYNITCSGAKNEFSEKSGAWKSVRIVQIRLISSGVSGRRRGILLLLRELERVVGVWNALHRRSSIIVHGFLLTLVCAHVSRPCICFAKKTHFWRLGKNVFFVETMKISNINIVCNPKMHRFAQYGVISFHCALPHKINPNKPGKA
jgi:hypothetical protein